MKAIATANVKNRNWRRDLQFFPLNYLATPHTTTKTPPATMMFIRNIRTKLPQLGVNVDEDALDQSAENCDGQARCKMKSYADERRHTKATTLSVGDTVLLKQNRDNKLSTKFNPKPLPVTNVKCTMITAHRPGFVITRNHSFFKIVPTSLPDEGGEEEAYDFEYPTREAEHQMQDHGIRYP